MKANTLNVLGAFCLVVVVVFCVGSVRAANLLTDDFEGYTADSALPQAGNWADVDLITIRDENTATPFGTVLILR